MTVPISKPAMISTQTAPLSPALAPIAVVVDAAGIHPLTAEADISQQVATFCWIDVFGGEETERRSLLTRLAMADAGIAALLRLGQTGRMVVGRQRLRAATWLAEPNGRLIEVHVLCTQERMVTVWNGHAAALEEVRQRFAERIGEVARSPYQAAGILLQLLLRTLDHVVRDLDSRLENLRARLEQDGASSIELGPLIVQRQELQSTWLSFDRYSSAVRAALVGIEAVAGIDARGAAELNDYADQVEDLEEQLLERRRGMFGNYARLRDRHRPASGRTNQSVDARFPDLSSHHRGHGFLWHELQLDDRRAGQRRRLLRAGGSAARFNGGDHDRVAESPRHD